MTNVNTKPEWEYLTQGQQTLYIGKARYLIGRGYQSEDILYLAKKIYYMEKHNESNEHQVGRS